MWNWQGLARALAVSMLFLSDPGTAFAQRSAELVCDHAASKAARQTGVPISVLRAITRTETGRTRDGALQPWPWTVNMEGAGHWFDARGLAQDYTEQHYKRGARSFDVGCFQLNYRWHHHGFPSLEAMFDPERNALYAAEFLRDLYAEFGDWSRAAGAYHSRTPKFATRYRARFDRIHATLASDKPPPGPPPVASRSILQPGALVTLSTAPGLGSLVAVEAD